MVAMPERGLVAWLDALRTELVAISEHLVDGGFDTLLFQRALFAWDPVRVRNVLVADLAALADLDHEANSLKQLHVTEECAAADAALINQWFAGDCSDQRALVGRPGFACVGDPLQRVLHCSLHVAV
ncbi:MAG: hypothetical protein ACPGXK_00070 [Phycisphaerae bacterium]